LPWVTEVTYGAFHEVVCWGDADCRERKSGCLQWWGFGFPVRVATDTSDTDAAAAAPPLRAYPTQRTLLRRHAGSWAAWALPPTITPKCARRGDSQAPLSQFIQRPPLHRHPTNASTPDRGLGCSLPTLQRVPLLPFLTTSAVSSALTVVGLLHPTADHEVHPVSGRTPTVADAATLFTDAKPFEAFPLQHSGNPSPGSLADQTENPKTHCRSTTPPVHRSPCPSRRSLQQNRPTPKCCLVPKGAALRGVTMPEVRCLRAALPRHRARCSLGLLLDFRLSPQNCSRHCPSKWTLPRHSDPVPTPKCTTRTAPTHCPGPTPSTLAGPPKRTARCGWLPAEADREPRTLRKNNSSDPRPLRTTRPILEGPWACVSEESEDRALLFRNATQQKVLSKQNHCRRRDRLPPPALATRRRDGRNEHRHPLCTHPKACTALNRC